MHNELKKQIVIFILENTKEFQINSATKTKFRPYIYDSTGNYLIGGEQVGEFINQAIELLRD